MTVSTVKPPSDRTDQEGHSGGRVFVAEAQIQAAYATITLS